ncbi:MAG: D-alanine--D-alanine ligase A, partial [Tepidiformaceae bacterium]
MAKQRVAVILGGRSGEHEVSVRSGRSVLAALDRQRWEPVPLGIT